MYPPTGHIQFNVLCQISKEMKGRKGKILSNNVNFISSSKEREEQVTCSLCTFKDLGLYQ